MRGGEGEMKLYLEVNGIRDLEKLVERAEKQTADLRETIGRINAVKLEIEAKINQPPAGADD